MAPIPAETTRKLLRTLQPGGSWPDIDYQDPNRSGWKTVLHLSNVATLARAYRSPGSKLHGDKSLRGTVLRSLDYWLSHDFQNSNWWWNQIGVPRSLLPTVLLVEEHLSVEQRSRALTILRRAQVGMTGQNLVWVTEITAVRGILENDPEMVSAAYRRIADEIRCSTGEGIQPDFSVGRQTWGFWLVAVSSVVAAEPVLKRSDVVFMYQAGRPTYEAYGATVLAWGGKPTPQAKADATEAGVRFFGSVGMVTEFGRYHDRFPQTYEQGLGAAWSRSSSSSVGDGTLDQDAELRTCERQAEV